MSMEWIYVHNSCCAGMRCDVMRGLDTPNFICTCFISNMFSRRTYNLMSKCICIPFLLLSFTINIHTKKKDNNMIKFIFNIYAIKEEMFVKNGRCLNIVKFKIQNSNIFYGFFHSIKFCFHNNENAIRFFFFLLYVVLCFKSFLPVRCLLNLVGICLWYLFEALYSLQQTYFEFKRKMLRFWQVAQVLGTIQSFVLLLYI